MADVKSVRDALEVRFAAQAAVFWRDPTGEYEAELDALNLGDVNIIGVKDDEFGVKSRLLTDQVNKYLVLWWQRSSPPRFATKTASTRLVRPFSKWCRATPNSAWRHCFRNRHQGSWRPNHHRNLAGRGRIPHGPSAALVETINNGKRISN